LISRKCRQSFPARLWERLAREGAERAGLNAGARVDGRERAWQEAAMSMLGSLKDVFVERAMRVVSDPRLTKVASDPRVMNAAMKAISLGGAVKSEVSKATRLAAGVFGLATEEELVALRMTIQTLEDTVATLEAQAAARRP
jgi:hypothetical protein